MKKTETVSLQSFSLTILGQDNRIMIADLLPHYSELIKDIDITWSIDFADLNNADYDLDIENSILTIHNFGLSVDRLLSSHYFRPQILLALTEGLRMTRHVEWLDGALAQYHPEKILLIGRICVADTCAHKIKYAWDAKIDDDDTMWKYLLCSEQSDMAVVFIKTLEKLLSSGIEEEDAMRQSMAASFNQWFASDDRVNDCDHDTLNMIDDMIASGQQFQSKKLQKNAIACLTIMGGERNSYIDIHLQNDIVKNPYYAAINDDVNQLHFMQCVTDMNKIHVGGIAFHDAALASRFSFLE